MIPRLLTGMARSLFLLACGFAGVAALACYGAYRCLRAAVRTNNQMPVRDAVFTTMTALVALTHVLREKMLADAARLEAPVEEVIAVVQDLFDQEETPA